MNKKDKIYIAGHNGMVGSAIVRALKHDGYYNVLTIEHKELDLREQSAVRLFFEEHNIDYVILAAAKVGGIKANMLNKSSFLYDNLMIQNNIINMCVECDIKQLIFLGSSCIYPKKCEQPIKEEYLMTSSLEPTNEGYAIAKIAGLKLAQYYHEEKGLNCINVMPCNLYGTNDNFNPENSHVLSSLIKKFVDALDENKSEVVLWGSGKARREFMHVDDLAQAILFLIENYGSHEIINIGCGNDITIKELSELIANKVGYNGKILWDISVPDGTLRKCLDVSKLDSMGYKPIISLEDGIEKTIKEYRKIKIGMCL